MQDPIEQRSKFQSVASTGERARLCITFCTSCRTQRRGMRSRAPAHADEADFGKNFTNRYPPSLTGGGLGGPGLGRLTGLAELAGLAGLAGLAAQGWGTRGC